MLMPLRRSLLSRLLPERACGWLAAFLILASAALHVWFLLTSTRIDLAPDEAHYWDWSRNLDWSYYSKGPLVAWIIRAGCAAFGGLSVSLTGNVAAAVRLPAVFFGSMMLVSLYVLTVQVYSRPRLGLAVVAAALTLPLTHAGSSLMTIDSPYCALWGWALVFAHRAVTGKSEWAWEACGVCVGLGILAKYTMAVFVPSLALFLLFTPQYRKLLWSPGFGSMIGFVALCCVPILVWNAQHDWVTFLHVRKLAGLAPAVAEAAAPSSGIQWLGPLAFVGGQVALLLVYWFVVWACGMVAHRPWKETDDDLRYLWFMSAPMFGVFLVFGFKTGGGELNWPVTAYLSGAVLAAGWAADQFDSGRLWYRLTCYACVTAAAVVGLTASVFLHRSDLAHPYLDRHVPAVSDDVPHPMRKLDPTCRLRGWKYLASQVDLVRERLQNVGIEPVLAGVNWTIPGELGAYCKGHPKVYCTGRAGGDRHSQYDLWANPIDHPEQFLGRTFVLVGPAHPNVLAAFASVEEPTQLTYTENGRPLAGWPVRVCRGFKGFAKLGPAGH